MPIESCPCCNEDHGEVVLAIQMLDKKLKESISAMSSLMRLGNELKLTDLTDVMAKGPVTAEGGKCALVLQELQDCAEQVRQHHVVMSTEMMLDKSNDEEAMVECSALVHELKVLGLQLKETATLLKACFHPSEIAGNQSRNSLNAAGDHSKLLRTGSTMQKGSSIGWAKAAAKKGLLSEDATAKGQFLTSLEPGDYFCYAPTSELISSSQQWSASTFAGSEGATLLVLSKKAYTAACIAEPIELMKSISCFPFMTMKRRQELALQLQKKVYEFNQPISFKGQPADKVTHCTAV